MRRRVILVLGGCLFLVCTSVLLVKWRSYGVQGAVQTAAAVAACTATPAIRAPTFTVSPAERSTPNAQVTAFARYEATYPGDVARPSKTTDLAPQIAQEDKQTVVIRHITCSYEYYLIAPDQQSFDTFVRGLPPGDTVVTIFAPGSVRGKRPPPATPRPNQTPGVAYGPNGTPITSSVSAPASIPPSPAQPFPTPSR